MNTYYVTDKDFYKSEIFNDFLEQNPGKGYLRIRAFTASQAIPMSGLQVEVSKTIMNNKVIFFEGVTDESGVTPRIVLPAPKTNSDNLVAPLTTSYDINVYYKPQNIKQSYTVRIYDGLCVAQNINIVPSSMMGGL